jgi:hypothetical protein
LAQRRHHGLCRFRLEWRDGLRAETQQQARPIGVSGSTNTIVVSLSWPSNSGA